MWDPRSAALELVFHSGGDVLEKRRERGMAWTYVRKQMQVERSHS